MANFASFDVSSRGHRQFCRMRTFFLMTFGLAFLLGGCETYKVPGTAANFRALGITEEQQTEMTEPSIARRLERRPAANFPAGIAVVRVQGSRYASHTTRGFGSGAFTIITTRDVEPDDTLERIAALPMVRSVSMLNRLVLPERLNSVEQLRWAAAEVQADMLLLYTFDTVFGVEDKLAPLNVITLGLFPQDEAQVTSTVSAALLDTRTGYVYGLAEATAHTHQLANAWTSSAAVDQSRRRAETEAFERLLSEIDRIWRQTARGVGSGQEDSPANSNGAAAGDGEAPADSSSG